jgi:TatD DNase family protein
MQLTDTHCHIQEAFVGDNDDAVHERWAKAHKDPDQMIADAAAAGVTRLVCVGCTVPDSMLAVAFAQNRPQCWAAIGIHPHEAQRYLQDQKAQDDFLRLATKSKVVAVGECGLDYFYNHSPKAAQEKMLRFQLELASEHGLPLIFHVREAFQDFWPIFDEYSEVTGVIHSFTATQKELDDALSRGLYIGLNGITTFMKDSAQLAAAKAVPLHRLLLETDAPFLTPSPERGRICEPKHVRLTAAFLSQLRGEPLEQIVEATTHNAQLLFSF